jgi:hypothetical protein
LRSWPRRWDFGNPGTGCWLVMGGGRRLPDHGYFRRGDASLRTCSMRRILDPEIS